jgi:voltage-gated potassium channel Kch
LFEKEVGIEMISAAFSGYMLLGTLFSLLFIAMGTSGAFKGPGAFVASSDYLYFSFVTLLTIGYGDIVPVTEIAKKLIVLLGLMGNFYTVFVVGIVIGKYLNKYR